MLAWLVEFAVMLRWAKEKSGQSGDHTPYITSKGPPPT